MSELTRCNYCTLKIIKARAKKERKPVKVVSAKYEGELEQFSSMGGLDVLVDGEKVAWFMAVSDHCVC